MSAVLVSRTRWVNRALKPLADSRRASGVTSRRMSVRSMRPAPVGWIIANCLRRQAEVPLLGSDFNVVAERLDGGHQGVMEGAEAGLLSRVQGVNGVTVLAGG